jgi:lysophospholipase L1-like esterase
MISANVNRRLLLAGLTALAPGIAVSAAPKKTGKPSGGKTHWVGTWASSQMIPSPEQTIPPAEVNDVTIRQIIRISMGGNRFRVRLSNVFGTTPLRIGAASLALSADPLTSKVVPESLRALTFGGQAGVLIPAGAEYLSDPLTLSIAPLTNLTLSLYLPEAALPVTSHPGARNLTHYVPGNQYAATELAQTKTLERWFYISGIDVEASEKSAAIVCLGDSITDGYGVKPATNMRWTDRLAERLIADKSKSHLSVLNHGIGGGRVLNDGLGPNAMARFDRDVIAQTGVKYLIVLEGVNDLAALVKDPSLEACDALVADMTGAYRQMAQRAHDDGIKVYGATILPFKGSNSYKVEGSMAEQARLKINQWIRTSGAYDAVIDLDRIMGDPAQPDQLNPALDSGDHLHPSMLGYRTIGNTIDLRLFS